MTMHNIPVHCLSQVKCQPIKGCLLAMTISDLRLCGELHQNAQHVVHRCFFRARVDQFPNRKDLSSACNGLEKKGKKKNTGYSHPSSTSCVCTRYSQMEPTNRYSVDWKRRSKRQASAGLLGKSGSSDVRPTLCLGMLGCGFYSRYRYRDHLGDN